MEKPELTNRKKAILGSQIADRLRKKAQGEETAVLTIVVSLLFGKDAHLTVTKGEDVGKSV